MNEMKPASKPPIGSTAGSTANSVASSTAGSVASARTGAKAEPTRNARAVAAPQQAAPQQAAPQQPARGAGGPNATVGQPRPAGQPRLPPQPEAAALSPSRSTAVAAAGAAAFSRPTMAAEQRGNGQPALKPALTKPAATKPASTDKTERSKSDKYTELEAAQAAPAKVGRTGFIPAAILLVAGAIGFGAFAQGGLSAGMSVLIAASAFVLLFGLHLVQRRLADTARLRNQVTELQQQLTQLQGAPDKGRAPSNEALAAQAAGGASQGGPLGSGGPGSPGSLGTGRAARISTADLEAAKNGALAKAPSLGPTGAGRDGASYRPELSMPPAAGSRATHLAGAPSSASSPSSIRTPLAAGAPLVKGTAAAIGAALGAGAGMRPAATSQPASSSAQTDVSGARQDKAPPLPPGVRSRSKLSAQPVGPDGRPIVTSVTPVPPPKNVGKRAALNGAPAQSTTAATGPVANGVIGPDTSAGTVTGAVCAPNISTASKLSAPNRVEAPLEAVSELMRAPGADGTGTDGVGTGASGAAAKKKRAGPVKRDKDQIERGNEVPLSSPEDGAPPKLPPIPSAEALPAAIPGLLDAELSQPELSQPELSHSGPSQPELSQTELPKPELSQPELPGAELPASDASAPSDTLTPSVDALRSVADEMLASEQRKDQQGDKAGPVVIAATDEHSWDGVGTATSEAQHNDAIIEAVASERIEIFVEPILGLGDKKARHFELSAQLKLLTGDRVRRSDYDEVLSAAKLRPVLDVAKLANSAQLAGRLHRSGKKASVFSDYSGEALASDLFLDQLAELLNSRDNLSGYLVLSLSLADVRGFGELHWDTLETLQELGFRFALEHVTDLDVDFDELKAKGFDFVKLDADVFLHGMPLDDLVVPAADLCRHLAEVGQTLIISAIEDETKLAKVLGFGVLLGQGSMFGKPRAVNLDVATKKSNAA